MKPFEFSTNLETVKAPFTVSSGECKIARYIEGRVYSITVYITLHMNPVLWLRKSHQVIICLGEVSSTKCLFCFVTMVIAGPTGGSWLGELELSVVVVRVLAKNNHRDGMLRLVLFSSAARTKGWQEPSLRGSVYVEWYAILLLRPSVVSGWAWSSLIV